MHALPRLLDRVDGAHEALAAALGHLEWEIHTVWREGSISTVDGPAPYLSGH